MKLGEILKEIKKLREELLDAREIIVRLDDGTESHEMWLKKHGVYDEDVIVVSIWIPYI